MSNSIILKNINKYYIVGNVSTHVLKSVDLEINKGDFIILMGKSGCGKSTLLNILGLLDGNFEGDFYLDGIDVKNIDEKTRARMRNENIGFIFQQFNLIQNLSIMENITLPLAYSKKNNKKELIDNINLYINKYELEDKLNNYPLQLSGGQQQRISIIRSIINNPQIILADEPTGALDSNNANIIMNDLLNLNKEGKTIIVVTHDKDLSKYGTKIINLNDGCIRR